MSKHTPTPWELNFPDHTKYAEEGQTYVLLGQNGNVIADDQMYYNQAPKLEDAEHIVKCVNEHKALKEQLEEIIRVLKPFVFSHAEDIEQGINDYDDLRPLLDIFNKQTRK